MPSIILVNAAIELLTGDKSYTEQEKRQAKRVLKERIQELESFMSAYPNSPLNAGFREQIAQMKKLL
jgi:hypothetical protein